MNFEKDFINLIAKHTGYSPEELSDNREFETDLNISRAELVEIISSIEDKFKLILENENLSEIKTVGDLKILVLDQLGVII